MKVNFNNVRKQAIYAYENLVKELNSAIIKDDQYAKPNSIHHDNQVNIKGYVLIDADDIQRCMDDLRSMIGAIAMTYEEGNDDFKDIFQEIYPNEDNSMSCFNEESEEE